jgi:AraC-like DNA-binding protein
LSGIPRTGRAPRPAIGTGTVLARSLAFLIDRGVSAGVPREFLLQAAGVSDADLRDPDGRTPVASEIALWQVLARHISDPGFGIRIGAAYGPRDAGLVGYAMWFSATLRDALRRLQRYGRLCTEAAELRLHEDRAHVTLVSHPTLVASQPLAQDFRLAALLNLSRALTGVDIVPVEVGFAHRQPSATLTHREYFRCPIRFGAPGTRMVLRTSDMDLAVLRSDETLAGYLSKYAEQVLASLVGGTRMRHNVRAAIWSALGDGRPSLARVASILHLPPRTLQRRLAAEGTSLHKEIDRIRKTMAIAHLRGHSAPIGDVAFLLGYTEPSAFFRAFKRWTGTTPHHFRSRAA